MRKIIIIPAYNEADSIEKLIKELESYIVDFDYIIINDGSTDNTEKICQINGYNYISLTSNFGIGVAVQTGYKYAKAYNYEIAVQMDGDGQHDPKYLNMLIEPILERKIDLVIGSRFNLHKLGFQSTVMRRIGIKYFSFLIRILTGKHLSDCTSGFRACNKRTISLFAGDYPRDYPEPESLMSLIRLGFSIEEVPVRMRNRAQGSSSITCWKSIYYMFKVTFAIIIDFIKPKNRYHGGGFDV